MKENELVELGFRKEEDDVYHYYVFDIAQGFDLISNASDEVDVDGEWYVEVFDTHPAIRFTDIEEVKVLVNLTTSRLLPNTYVSDILNNDLEIQDALDLMINSVDDNDVTID